MVTLQIALSNARQEVRDKLACGHIDMAAAYMLLDSKVLELISQVSVKVQGR